MGAPLKMIGELINNSYGRARKAWIARDISKFQDLAKSQTELGVDYLTLNIDGTQDCTVRLEEMLAFLPDLIPAIQEVSRLPISFDNPSLKFHEVCMEHYDRSKSPQPIINSVAASRDNLDGFIDLIKQFDTHVIVMASEKFIPGGGAACFDPRDVHASTRTFMEMLSTRAGRTADNLIVDPGLPPVGADTYGLVNTGLDGMELIHNDPDLKGIHMSVGLSNFAWGTPRHIRHKLECAYLTLAVERGLDYVLANPERKPVPLDPGDPLVDQLKEALRQGRPQGDESQEDAGFRQAEYVNEICQQHVEA
jgi:5-methyltetrahydrofolate corrinoid/iron sulfur protein methyltransferase